MTTTTREPITDWGRASCLALVAALERDEFALIDPDALAAPWSRVAKLATQTRPLPDDGAVGFARLLTPGWCAGADIGGPAWVEERFYAARGELDATSTEYLMDRARLLGERTADGERIDTEQIASDVELVRASDVIPEPVRWWWRGRLALGKLTVLEGPPDVGKSTLLIDIAARVTRGKPMPDGTPAPEGPGGVLMLAAVEDGMTDTIVPRLTAAGADLDRVTVWRGRREDDGYVRGFELTPADLTRAERLIVEEDVRLVIIDALMAAIPEGTNSHRDTDMRRRLHPLAAMAERTGAIVVVNRHHRKGAGGPAIDRGAGTLATGAVARAVLGAVRDPDDDSGERRILGVAKANLIAESEKASMAYTIVSATVAGLDGALVETSRIAWMGSDSRTLNDVLAAGDDTKKSEKTRECADAIRELLADGPMAAKEIEAALAREEYKPATIRAARPRAGVSRELGTMWQDGFRGPWFWSLTPRNDPTGANN